jgi:VWFA-related protein
MFADVWFEIPIARKGRRSNQESAVHFNTSLPGGCCSKLIHVAKLPGMRFPRFLLVLTALVAARAQIANPPTIRTTSQLVLVDVTVTDAHGSTVHGLKAADFHVLENGAAQTITHFEEHATSTGAPTAEAAEAPQLPPNVYTNFTAVPSNAPLNILLVDSLNTGLDKQANLVRQLTGFIEHLDAGSNFAVFELSSRLRMLQGFTADRKLLLDAIAKAAIQKSPALHEVTDAGLGEEVRLPSDQGEFAAQLHATDAMQAAQQDRLRVVMTLQAMNQLARYLGGIPGRKNLLWYAGSFPLNPLPSTLTGLTYNSAGAFQDKIRQLVNLMARSEVVVYPIGANGVATNPTMEASGDKYALNVQEPRLDSGIFTNQVMDSEDTAQRIAAATGGKAYLNFNDLGQATTRALKAGADYYNIAYTPSGGQDTGGYRKIEVRMSSGGYTLNYRDGYYAEPSAAAAASKPAKTKDRAQDAAANIDFLHSDMRHGAPEPTEILFKVILVASEEQSKNLAAGNVATPKCKPPYRLVTAAYAADPGDIIMPRGLNGSREVALEFAAVVYDKDGAAEVEQSNTVHVFVKPDGYEQFLKEGVRFQQQIAVPARGDYFVRVGIHDLIGDKAGAVEVPAASIAAAGEPSR